MTELSQETPPPGSQRANAARASLFSGMRIVSLLTFVSRLLGLVRDMGMATVFGTSVVMDAFSVAFRIPNLARRLFGEGALTSAFLPAFVREIKQSGQESAWKLASAVLTLLAAFLCALVIVVELALCAASALGGFGQEAQLLIGLTIVTLPYLVLICLVAQVSAILHAMGHFTWPALVPVVLNLMWIGTLWWITPLYATEQAKIYVIAGCIVVAGFVQLFAQVPTLLRLGFRFDAHWKAARSSVADICRAMLPVVVGLSITQLNTLMDSLMAWSFARPLTGSTHIDWLPGRPAYPLEPGTASTLYFGQRMYQFPLGIFGVAIGTVLFPLLSWHVEQGRLDRLRSDLSLGIRMVVGLTIPASLGLVLLAEPIAVLLFQHGQFDANDTRQTVGMISAYGSAVWAYCGLSVVHRGFYAVGDRLTPLRVGLLAIVFNVTLNLVLIWYLAGRGLAIGTALTAMLQMFILLWLIQMRIGRLQGKELLRTTGKAIVATAIMGCVCQATVNLLGHAESTIERLAWVGLPVGASVVTYFACARLLGMEEPWLLFRRDLRPAGHDPESD